MIVNSINSTSTLRKVQQELRSPLRVQRLLCSLSRSPDDVIQMAGCCQSRRVYVPRGGWARGDRQGRAVCLCLVQGCAGHPFAVLLSALIKLGLSAFRAADKSRSAIEEKGSACVCMCLFSTFFFFSHRLQNSVISFCV